MRCDSAFASQVRPFRAPQVNRQAQDRSRMDVLNEYLATVPAELRERVRTLDALVHKAAPRLTRSLKWGNLTYHHTANVCALVTHRQHVNLQVWAGAEIADPDGLLRGTGKQMRHIRFDLGPGPDRRAVAAIVRAAAEGSGARPRVQRARRPAGLRSCPRGR
jgi:hypothetical protein